MAEELEDQPLSEEEVNEIYNREWKRAGSFDTSNVRVEGKHVFAEIKFPAGGALEGDELIDSAIIRAGSGKDDMLLMNSDYEQDEALKRMVSRQVVSLGEDEDRSKINRIVREALLLGDYNYLIFKVRQLTVGDKVVFNGVCKNCNNSHEYSIKISDLEFEIPDGFDPNDATTRLRSFEYDFWGTKWKVNWHFATEGDISYLKRLITQEVKRHTDQTEKKGKGKTRRDSSEAKKAPEIDYRYIVSGGESKIDFISSNLISRVDSIEEPSGNGESKLVHLGRREKPTVDELSSEQSLDYLKDLPSPLRLELWKQMNGAEPAMDTEINFDCLTCASPNSETIHPLSPNFFFPSEIQLG